MSTILSLVFSSSIIFPRLFGAVPIPVMSPSCSTFYSFPSKIYLSFFRIYSVIALNNGIYYPPCFSSAARRISLPTWSVGISKSQRILWVLFSRVSLWSVHTSLSISDWNAFISTVPSWFPFLPKHATSFIVSELISLCCRLLHLSYLITYICYLLWFICLGFT